MQGQSGTSGGCASDQRRHRAGALIAALLVSLLSLPAWALHWPWQHNPAPPPSTVQALSVTLDAGAAAGAGAAQPAPVTQYWDRNALLLDLTRLPGTGGATLTPRDASGWPVRLEFRVLPGAMARLEVQGAQRVVFSIPTHGAALVMKLDPDVYASDTAHIRLLWSAAGDSLH